MNYTPNKTLFFTLTYSRLDYLKLMIESLRKTVPNYDNINHLFIIQGDKETREWLISDKNWNPNWICQYNEKNMGLPWGWNFAIDDIIDCGFDYAVKIDDDAIFETKGWLDAAKKVVDNFSGLAVVSPAVKGLVANKGGVPRFAKYATVGVELGFVPHLGGISLVTSPKVYNLFGRFNEYDPLHSGQDTKFSSRLVPLGVRFFYLEEFFVSHGPEGTKAQEEKYKEYFSRRNTIERVKSLKEMNDEN